MSIELIHQCIRLNKEAIIGVDGEPGAGKTTLARELAQHHGIHCIHLDDFLSSGRGAYVDALRLGKISGALSKLDRPIIIEGICLLNVLQRLGVSPHLHVFMRRDHGLAPYKINSRIVAEFRAYLNSTNADNRAKVRLTMPVSQTTQHDVDIAYLKAKSIVSVTLALGGIVAIIVGAFVLNVGIQSENSAEFEFLGAKVSAKGIGGVILSSSVLWAYFAYLSRPKYSRKTESRRIVAPDGTEELHEFESSTMARADSPSHGPGT